MSSPPPAERERLFLALWPDPGLQRAIERAAREAVRETGGRPVPAENLHITVLFVGSVERERRHCLEQALAARGDLRAFTLELDRLGYWRRPRVLWLAPTHVPEALEELAAALRAAASGCGLATESRPLRPHLTLARKARRRGDAQALGEALCWPVDRYCLVRSQTLPEGARYESIGEWPLA